MIIYVTDIDKFSDQKSFLENIKNSSLFGIEYIQIRFKNLDQNSKTILTQKINEIIDKSNTPRFIKTSYYFF